MHPTVTGSTIVPAKLLAEALAPLLERLDEQLAASPLAGSRPLGPGQGAGALNLVCERAAHIADRQAQSFARRLYEVRYCEERGRHTTDVTIAEALLIALDTDLDEQNLPVMPGSHRGAQEAVEAWAEDWAPEHQRVLAGSLFRFTEGFVSALTSDVPESICALVAHDTQHARRLLEADGSVVSDHEVEQFQHFARGFWHATMPEAARTDSLKRSHDRAYLEALR